jgi:hypothetical protein
MIVKLTWYSIAVRRKGSTKTKTVAHVTPVGWEGIDVISREGATIGSQVVPLKQDQFARNIVWQLEAETIKVSRHPNLIVGGNSTRCDVRTVGIVGILGSSVQRILDEFKGVILEAVARRLFSVLNRTREELEVPHVMSSEEDVDIDLLTLRILSLRQ